MRLRVSMWIRASPRQVFDWWTDFSEEDPKLSGRILRSRGNLQRRGDVITFSDEGRMLGVSYQDSVEVTLFPPDRWTARYISNRFEAFSTYTVKPQNNGTFLTVETEVKLKGILKLFGWLAGRRIERTMAREWSDYRELMEREARKPETAGKPL